MKIEKILAGIRDTKNEKTAAAVTTPAVTSPVEGGLKGALAASLAHAEKTAGEVAPARASDPVTDIMKTAADLAAAEKQAAVAEAEVLGRAYMDSAIARYTDWAKTASVNVPAYVPGVAPSLPQLVFSKFASEQGTLVKQAAQTGYESTAARLQKEAQAEYERGFNDKLAEVRQVAAREFVKAAAITQQVIENSRKQTGAR